MNLHLYDITPSLQPYIKVICSVESSSSKDILSSFRVLPDTCIELFVNYTETQQTITTGSTTLKQPRSFITSRMSRYMDVSTHERPGFISVCFLAGAAMRFFHYQ